MTRDDIIRMAEKSGFYFHDAGYAPILHTVSGEYSEQCFERFAALIAAAGREACAKACDESVIGFGTETQWAQGYVQGIKDVADGIRARSTP